MDAQTINQTYDLLSLVSHHTRLRKSGCYHVGRCPFCGGKDRFTLKNTSAGWRWHCRHCGNDKYHTAIDFAMRIEGIDFKAALKKLGGDVRPPLANSNSPRPPRKKIELPSEDWQKTGLKLVTEWAHQLTDDRPAEAGRKYLESRGLHPGTWDAWLLGYAVIYGRPAITIPWMDTNGVEEMLFAVKYRFIDDLAKNDKGKRYGMLKGSKQFLFGLQHVLDTDETLMLVEGELNAMSIWQCLPSRVAPVSIGGQNVNQPEVLRILAKRFKRVDVWMDDVSESSKAVKDLHHPGARWLHSPVLDSVKYDANAALQAGFLPDFLSQRYGVPCWGRLLDKRATV